MPVKTNRDLLDLLEKLYNQRSMVIFFENESKPREDTWRTIEEYQSRMKSTIEQIKRFYTSEMLALKHCYQYTIERMTKNRIDAFFSLSYECDCRLLN